MILYYFGKAMNHGGDDKDNDDHGDDKGDDDDKGGEDV